MIGISIAESLFFKGYDCLICFDDLSKHSKFYRQISLLLGLIPSRDAFPAAVFNVHSSLLERCGKLSYSISSVASSITAFPIIETINSDITEYIATNVISITDGQFYLSKNLFILGQRPAIDSGLSVSRIGSNAQCRFIKVLSSGIKNDLTILRSANIETNSLDFFKLNALNCLYFQDHLFISSIELLIILLLFYRHNFLVFNFGFLHKLYFLLSSELFYFYYLVFLAKFAFSLYTHNLFISFIKFILSNYF